MAGHIDHGKTTLTKALTEVDTDRLKEEKERQISIELGFAPLYEDDELQISVIDVPGHERFIRQMIAGVAGIDLVILVVAAEEGVMPQTSEHLDILRFLGIKNGIVAITKIDRVEEDFIELVKEDIQSSLVGTVFEDSPLMLVDSISKKGIPELKQRIIDSLKEQEMRNASGAFRLPIDQVFTVKGQGTVVRGTVYEGSVAEGETLRVLPEGKETRARQLQVHHQKAEKAYAGQRVAINLSNVSKEELKRGDVLVSSDHFIVTNSIDVAIHMVGDLEYMVKQRMPIKCHIGTAEVMGRIVFFDRNELKEESGEILCQLRLEHDIVTKRGDRFIIRRPSPQETIGGGWVIDAKGEKYRFGEKTVEALERKKIGSPIERITDTLIAAKSLSLEGLIKQTALDEKTLLAELEGDAFVFFNGNEYTMQSIIDMITADLGNHLLTYHDENPLKQGLNKAELFHGYQGNAPKSLLEYILKQGLEKGPFSRKGQFIHHQEFQPHVPANWEKRTEGMLQALHRDGTQVKYIQDYFEKAGIPEFIRTDLYQFFVAEKTIVPLNEEFCWHGDVFNNAVNKVRKGTEKEFAVGDAKDILDLTRKYLIPFLEALDREKLTRRVENKRIWLPVTK